MNQVLEIIKQRHYSGSKPGKRKDLFKVALCVEGGCMRGIVSAGELAAIDYMRLQPAFDVVYGSSAGAYGGAYFLSGHPLDGAKIYLNLMNNNHFISYSRFLKGGPLVSLDYLHIQMTVGRPLKWHRVIDASPPLHVIATDADKAESIIFKGFRNKQDLYHALYASAYLPVSLKLSPFRWRHHKYFDAGFFDPFGINAAIKEGCTHICILFSKPWQHRHSLGIIDQQLVKPFLQKINHHLAQMYLSHEEYSVNGLSHVWNHYDGTHILAVAPSKKDKLPNQLTVNRKVLARGFLAGAEAAFKAFEADEFLEDVSIKNMQQILQI